ncbi:hypothetical protein ABLO26_24850 [Neobacillus sp. 179-J 1A1 HS]
MQWEWEYDIEMIAAAVNFCYGAKCAEYLKKVFHMFLWPSFFSTTNRAG